MVWPASHISFCVSNREVGGQGGVWPWKFLRTPSHMDHTSETSPWGGGELYVSEPSHDRLWTSHSLSGLVVWQHLSFIFWREFFFCLGLCLKDVLDATLILMGLLGFSLCLRVKKKKKNNNNKYLFHNGVFFGKCAKIIKREIKVQLEQSVFLQ